MNGRSLSILVVEDDPDIQENLDQILTDEGYQVLAASNGQEALKLLEGMPASPNLILLDLMMPVMDGIDFLKALRNDAAARHQALPVVLVTAAPLSGEREVSIRPWVSEVIRKPFGIDFLLEAVRRLHN